MARVTLTFFIFTLYSIIGVAQKVTPYFECTSKLENPYGVCSHFTRTDKRNDYGSMTSQLKMMKSIGIGNVRCDIDYGTINNNGTGILDEVLTATKNYGINFLGIAYDSEFYKKTWSSIKNFRGYLATLENMYLNRFSELEFVNEVDLCKQNEACRHYLLDLKNFNGIKAYKPAIKILFSGLSDTRSKALDTLMTNGAYRYFDIMNFHAYPNNEDSLIARFNALKGNMEKYHWSMPVWITEIGMHTASKLDKSNTNYEFFTKVVPQALKRIGKTIKGLNYGIIRDTKAKYSTLTDSEIEEYILKRNAIPMFLTLDQLKDVDVSKVPVIVATSDESFPSQYFPYLLNYVKRGGTTILPYGAPLYYDRAESGWKSVGSMYANQLHIGELFWWTDEAKKLNAPETPTYSKESSQFGYNYAYTFDKNTGRTARYLTSSSLRGNDKMMPITYAGNDKYRGVVAALYQLNSDLKGNFIIQTRVRTQRYVDKEVEQARRLARFYLTSFAYGIDKVFWYNFRACEIDSTYSEDNFGIVHKDLSPKPAYFAYKMLTTMCPSGSSRPTLEKTGNIYVSKWTRPDGKSVTALWSPNGITYTKVNIVLKAKVYNYMGKEIKSFDTNRFMVTSGVTYIVK